MEWYWLGAGIIVGILIGIIGMRLARTLKDQDNPPIEKKP